MKIRIIILTLLIFPLLAYTQNIFIKGKVIHYKTLQPMIFTQILFDSLNQAVANEKGEFELEVSKQIVTNALKVRFIGCFELNIINIPNNQDLIDLGSIPIFDYSPGYDMTHFNCPDYDSECKEKEKQHIEKENKRIKDYYINVHTLIEYFDYSFQNKTYKIDIDTGCIDLNSEN